MRIHHALAATLFISLGTATAWAEDAAPAAAVAAAPAYSTAETDIGTLFDDPAAKAILDKHIPGFSTGDGVEQARPFTLEFIKPYDPRITDEVLQAINADFAALAGKK